MKSTIYLVRHGQAGTRQNYDALSELGQRQARLLGEFFEARAVRFEAAYSGSLARQQATARQAGFDRAICDPGWDEFDLSQVLGEFSSRLAADDDDFRRAYEEMTRLVETSGEDPTASVHRRWNECDRKAVAAWIEARYPFSGESWNEFSARIASALDRLAAREHPGNVIVFTSATPAAICAARALGILDGRAMQLAGVMLNTAFSTLRVRSGEAQLFSFNTTPHLELAGDKSLKTFR